MITIKSLKKKILFVILPLLAFFSFMSSDSSAKYKNLLSTEVLLSISNSTYNVVFDGNGALDGGAVVSQAFSVGGSVYYFNGSGRCYSGNGCSSSCNY